MESVLLDSMVRTFPPPPSDPLVRQRATGAEIDGIVFFKTPPPYYAYARYDERVPLFTIPVALAGLKRGLPENVTPHVMYIRQPYGLGYNFTIVLHSSSSSSIHNIRSISDLCIPEELAWEYIACDYLRYLGNDSELRLSYISEEQEATCIRASIRCTELHVLLRPYILC